MNHDSQCEMLAGFHSCKCGKKIAMSDTPTLETDEATLTEQFLIRDLPLSVVAAASQRFERELNAALTENTAMREAIKTAHDDLLKIATMPEYDQDDSHRLRNLGMKAAAKLQQIITP
jgi:hypothetical protein